MKRSIPRFLSIILILFGALILNPHLFQNTLPMDERSVSYLPERILNIIALRQGTIPLWNPYSFFGCPHIANHQCAFFYPSNLILFLAFSPVQALKISSLLHFFAAGMFTFLLLRRLGAGRTAAIAAGLIFMGSGHLIAHEGHVSDFNSSIWVPLWFYFVEGALQRRNRWNLAGGAITFALLIFAGYMHIAVMASLMTAVYLLVWLVSGRGRKRLMAAALCVIMMAWGASLSAVQILTTRDVVSSTMREQLDYSAFTSYHFPISHLPILIFPLLFGASRTGIMTVYRGAFNLAELTGWSGIFPLLLAIVGFFALKGGRRRHIAWGYLIIGVFSFLLCLGPQTPLYKIMFRIPVYNMFRSPAKNWLHVNLAVAVLAGLGVHALMLWQSRRPAIFKRLIWFLIIGMTCIGTVMLLFIILSHYFPTGVLKKIPQYITLKNPAIWVPLTSVLATILLLIISLLTGKKGFLAPVALLFLLEASFTKDQLAMRSGDLSMMYDSQEKNPVFAHIRSHEKDLHSFRIYPIHLSMGEGTCESLYPSFNIPYQIRSLSGYGPLFPKYLAPLFGIISTGTVTNIEYCLTDNRIFSMMNIKYLTILPYRFKNRRYNNIFSILESTTTPNGALTYKLHLTTPTGVKLFENTQAFPRAYSVSRIISVSQLGEKQKDMTKTIYYLSNPQNSFNLREEAFYAGPVPPVLNRQFAHADVEAVNVGPNRVRARVDSDDTAFIVFSELYYRGWRAYVDGKRAKLYGVNVLLCGVVIPRGAKEIELVYRPAGFKRGALVSGVALLFLIGIMALPGKNKKACYESNG